MTTTVRRLGVALALLALAVRWLAPALHDCHHVHAAEDGRQAHACADEGVGPPTDATAAEIDAPKHPCVGCLLLAAAPGFVPLPRSTWSHPPAHIGEWMPRCSADIAVESRGGHALARGPPSGGPVVSVWSGRSRA